MNNLKKITIHLGGTPVELKMLYCAAAETGYEQLSGKSSDVFCAQRGTDGVEKAEVIPPAAKLDDYIKLAISSIIAAYSRDGQESPVSAEQILYDCTSQDVTLLVTTVLQLRNEWYRIPEVVGSEAKAEETPKN